MLRPTDAGDAKTHGCGFRIVKICNYDASKVTLPLIEGYRIAGHTITSTNNFIVTLESDTGLVGLGCAAPAVEVTGESDDMCFNALQGQLQDRINGADVADDPSHIALDAIRQLPKCPAACAAIDIALWDLAAQKAQQPLFRYWGGASAPIATSVTIGICDVEQTLAEARQWLARGFNILKVKIGDNIDADIERLTRLREQLGAGCVIRVDANQGYDLAGARRLLRETANLGLEMIEQPLQQHDLDDMAQLTGKSSVPIIADESADSIEGCKQVVDRRAAHGINIKLMKCGGPSAARVIHDYAHAAGLTLMFGCNDETRISIAAALHLAQTMPGLVYIDLDGHMDLAEDPVSGGFEIRDGAMHLSERPGLGVTTHA